MAVPTNLKAALNAFYVEEALNTARIALPVPASVPSELGRRAPMNASARRATTTPPQPRLHRHPPRTLTASPISTQSATRSLNSSTSSMNVRTKTTVRIEKHTHVRLTSQLSSAKTFRAASAQERVPRPHTAMLAVNITPSKPTLPTRV